MSWAIICHLWGILIFMRYHSWYIFHNLPFLIYIVHEISFKSRHSWHIVQELNDTSSYAQEISFMSYRSWYIIREASLRSLILRLMSLSRISRCFLPDKGGRWWWWMCHRRCRVWSPVCWRETTASLVWYQGEAGPRSNLRIKYHFLVSSRWSNNDFVFNINSSRRR